MAKTKAEKAKAKAAKVKAPAGSDYIDEDTGALPADVLHIDPTSVKDDLVRLPGYFATYGEVAAELLREELRAKDHAKRTEARLYLAYKGESDELKGDGKRGAFTEPQLKALVQTHPETQIAQERLIHARTARQRALAHLDAIHAKRDALMSITGHVRDERRALGLTGAADDDED